MAATPGTVTDDTKTGQARPQTYLHAMRSLIALLLTALPATAWEFTPNPVCTLDHAQADVAVKLTYDHTTQIYAIAITRAQGWPDAPVFSMRFDGGQPLTISTTRHKIAGNTVTATDTGFGNVLNGLEFNRAATAFTATSAATFSLDGAAEPVERFRNCTTIPVA
jgi:hypothetical protein